MLWGASSVSVTLLGKCQTVIVVNENVTIKEMKSQQVNSVPGILLFVY